MASTTRTQIPTEVNNFYDRTMLERAVPLFIHTLFAQVRDIPRKVGTDTIKFRRYGNLTAATTPLSDGVTPAGSQLSVTDITAQIQQYGDFVTLTDKVDMESPDPVLMETAELFGDQIVDTLDQLTRDILVAGTSVSYAGTGNTARADVAAADVILAANVDSAVETIKGNNARRITTMVDPDPGIGTVPIKPAFIGINHTNITKAIEAFTGFVSVEKYQNRTKIMPGEYGYYRDVRFLETTNAKVFTGAGTGGIDVYATLIMGANAYGTTRISGEALHNIVKALGSAGSEDPLDQRMTSGWKGTYVAKRLNETFMTRIEHARV